MPSGALLPASRAPLAALLSLRALLVASAAFAAPGPPAQLQSNLDARVLPVAGGSWLDRTGLFFSESSLGRMGKSGSPPPRAAPPAAAPAARGPGLAVPLSGLDLYRLNCASCHGPSGAGAPPEIRSVIGPARATSPELLIAQMKGRGVDLAPGAAREMAAEAEKVLRLRLRNGGTRMPSFGHLDAAETAAILAYLRELSGAPGSRSYSVLESPLRVGEHVVRGTCHVCHSATGPGPREVAGLAFALERSLRPSLQGMAHELSLAQFAGKVLDGASVAMPVERGAMPVFDYLTAEEVRDAFLYLLAYPPGEEALREDAVRAASRRTGSPPSRP